VKTLSGEQSHNLIYIYKNPGLHFEKNKIKSCNREKTNNES
jgi:hypothetical protein